MKKILIVGGANGIGLSIAQELSKKQQVERIYIVDKSKLENIYKHPKIQNYVFDITNKDYSFFDQFNDINTLIITAGFGKLSLFENLDEEYIINSFNVNTISVIRIIKKFFYKINNEENFYCGVMVSIAGFMSSPFFSVYAASKAALKIFIESVNVELLKNNISNRILNVSPGNIKGTNFYNGKNDLSKTSTLAQSIIKHLEEKRDLYIPAYEEIFKDVLERYHKDFRAEGIHSYEYKLKSKRS